MDLLNFTYYLYQFSVAAAMILVLDACLYYLTKEFTPKEILEMLPMKILFAVIVITFISGLLSLKGTL